MPILQRRPLICSTLYQTVPSRDPIKATHTAEIAMFKVTLGTSYVTTGEITVLPTSAGRY